MPNARNCANSRGTVLCQTRADTRYARQQRRRSGVGIDPHRVHAILYHGVERARQFVFAQIMLVLADADRFRIDLDQFGEGILQPPRNRHGAAQSDVEVRQFLRRISGGRIDRSAGLRYDDLRHFQIGQELDQFGGELVGLSRCGAVADRDQFDFVLCGELAKHGQRLVPTTLRRFDAPLRVNHVRLRDAAEADPVLDAVLEPCELDASKLAHGASPALSGNWQDGTSCRLCATEMPR